MLLVAMPFVPSSFLLLVVRPGAPSSVLAPNWCLDFKHDVLMCSFLSARKARLTSAQRHAKRSADYWERKGALEYAKDGN